MPSHRPVIVRMALVRGVASVPAEHLVVVRVGNSSFIDPLRTMITTIEVS